MNTTWRIIRLYVASILTVVIGNVEIRVALSFGPTEDTALYNTFYLTFRSLLSLALSPYILESDQGSALRAICSKYHNRHLTCLRHLLVSLGRKSLAWEIGNLVRCQTDFERLKRLYEQIFAGVKPQDQNRLDKALRKIGL
jgi:hypothetical protein